MLKTQTQNINGILFDIFGINYTVDVQEFQNFYHVSVLKKEETPILPDEYSEIYKRLTLIDSPITAYNRLYFKATK